MDIFESIILHVNQRIDYFSHKTIQLFLTVIPPILQPPIHGLSQTFLRFLEIDKQLIVIRAYLFELFLYELVHIEGVRVGSVDSCL